MELCIHHHNQIVVPKEDTASVKGIRDSEPSMTLLRQKGWAVGAPTSPEPLWGGRRQPPGPEAFFRDTRDQPAGLAAYPLHLPQSCEVYH